MIINYNSPNTPHINTSVFPSDCPLNEYTPSLSCEITFLLVTL